MLRRKAQRATEGIARFPLNPEDGWGPKARATGGKKDSKAKGNKGLSRNGGTDGNPRPAKAAKGAGLRWPLRFIA